ncbi:MAG: hypothetical protein USCAAHI_01988 [Beijerinckiaceae bacterium]|nr:MAG: hypothetical protein USCAAHI_01988 [Beijerinckiaceae bacterium]
MLATSPTLAARWMIDDGRFALTKAAPASSSDCPVTLVSLSIFATPSESVGPGSTELTVTPVPATRLASPRAMESCAVLVKP